VTSLLHGTPASLIPTPSTVFAGTSCEDANGTPRVGEMLGLWVFATHKSTFKLFTLGQPAMRELAMLSQTGRPFFLASALDAMNNVGNVFTVPASFPPSTLSDVVLCPGQSMTVTVTSSGANKYLSLAAMIFPTNDGFIAVNGVELPTGNDVVEVYSPAYDSGSEENDELCGDIPSLIFAGFPFPGTSIGGAGVSPGGACPDGLSANNDINSDPTTVSSPDNNPTRAEGYVHIHPGIRGIGDLAVAAFGWDGPVAKITIQRTH
jgi:hypothetical protein